MQNIWQLESRLAYHVIQWFLLLTTGDSQFKIPEICDIFNPQNSPPPKKNLWFYSTFNSEIHTQLIKIYPKENLNLQYFCPLYWTYFVGGGALETVTFIADVVLLKVWCVQLLYLFLDVQVERRLPELHVLPHSVLLYTGVGKLDDPRTQSL